MLPEQVEEREEDPTDWEESRRRDAVLAPEEEDEHRLRRDAVQRRVLRLRPLLHHAGRGHGGGLREVDERLDQVAQMGRGWISSSTVDVAVRRRQNWKKLLYLDAPSGEVGVLRTSPRSWIQSERSSHTSVLLRLPRNRFGTKSQK